LVADVWQMLTANSIHSCIMATSINVWKQLSATHSNGEVVFLAVSWIRNCFSNRDNVYWYCL